MQADRLENRASCLENDKSFFNIRGPALAILTVRRIWWSLVASALCHRPRWPTTNMIMLSAVATIHPPFQGVSGLGVSRRPCWLQTRISTDGCPHQYSSSGRPRILVKRHLPRAGRSAGPSSPVRRRLTSTAAFCLRVRRACRYSGGDGGPSQARYPVRHDAALRLGGLPVSESVPDQFRKGY